MFTKCHCSQLINVNCYHQVLSFCLSAQFHHYYLLDLTNYPIYPDNQYSDVYQRPRTLTAARLPISSPELEERDLANIQTVMAQSYPLAQSNRTQHLLQFPYDNSQFQSEQIFSNYGAYAAREQGLVEEPGISYYEERANNYPYSFKHQLELPMQSFNGPFLTQELERLHMTFGTENLFDKSYFYQRDIRA